MDYVLKNKDLTVTISDRGAELRSVKSTDGHEYMWSADARYWSSTSPILFPLCGRILDGKYTYLGKEYSMGAHGFARKSAFEVISASDTSITFRLTENEETLKEYPFNFELTASFILEKNSLSADITVKNTDKKILPYMLGWHPGFVLEGNEKMDNFALDFEGKTELTFFPLQNVSFVRPYGEEYKIQGKYQLVEEDVREKDTVIFVGTGEKTRLYSKNAPHSVEFSWSENLPYFCIWKHPASEARYICLEPWSGVPADGVTPENFETRKMSRLLSGECEKYSYLVKFL